MKIWHMIGAGVEEAANRNIPEGPDIRTGREGFWIAIIIICKKLNEQKNIWINEEHWQRHWKCKKEPSGNLKDGKCIIWNKKLHYMGLTAYWKQ